MSLYYKPIQDEISKSYTKDQIRKIYDDKIKELSENGFYIDIICKNSHDEDIIKVIDKIYEEYNVSHENNQYMIFIKIYQRIFFYDNDFDTFLSYSFISC